MPRWPLAVGAVLLLLIGLALAMIVRRDPAPAGAEVNVAMPAPMRTTIYGAATARGRPIVVIDAGHGGSDPGARSADGTLAEKEVTLALATALKDELVRRGRLRVAMTRDSDASLTLDQRAALARSLDAAIFVSLHCDSAPNPLARGATVYSLSDVASDVEAAKLAAGQNRSMAGVSDGDGSVRTLMADLAVRSQMDASADLAMRIVRRADGRVGLRPNPHRFAAFHVLRRAETPAVLVEAGYISNAEDEALLRDPAFRKAIVEALAAAIETDIASRR